MGTTVSDQVQNLSVKHPAVLDKMTTDKVFAKKIMDTFIKDVNSRGKVIKKALNNRDQQTIKAQANTIKASSGSIGVKSLQDVACQIEVAGQSGNLAQVGLLASKINEYCEILKKHWRDQNVDNLVSFYDNFDCRR